MLIKISFLISVVYFFLAHGTCFAVLPDEGEQVSSLSVTQITPSKYNVSEGQPLEDSWKNGSLFNGAKEVKDKVPDLSFKLENLWKNGDMFPADGRTKTE